ncbi:hypothetical protein V8V93_17685 [Pseudodesulfovibrio methanolicus]|uniref:Uncharacterized protein n=1 Tax=Pseudodesulfovibrio methanolicus TaxID=3126690 RepID=A0ABZ2IUW3_9BACT
MKIRPLQVMARTLAAHRFGILAYYDPPISSGPIRRHEQQDQNTADRSTAAGIRNSSNSGSWASMNRSTLYSDEPKKGA